jgi:hypothetical protein
MVGDRPPANLSRLIQRGLWPRPSEVPVFVGPGSQARRDEHARRVGHRFMVAYQLPAPSAGNCYLSCKDAPTFCQLYHRLLCGVYQDSGGSGGVAVDDVCFYEQLYLPCRWYFDVEEEEAGRPLAGLGAKVEQGIYEAVRRCQVSPITAVPHQALCHGVGWAGRSDERMLSADVCGAGHWALHRHWGSTIRAGRSGAR